MPSSPHCHLSPPKISSVGAAAVWGLATTSTCRRSLAALDVIPKLFAAIKRSLKLQTVPDPDPADVASGEAEAVADVGSVTESLRSTFQRHLIGALAMLLVDRDCRRPCIELEPNFATLFELCKDIEGYRAQDAKHRRETAAKVGTGSHMIQEFVSVRMYSILIFSCNVWHCNMR